MSRGKHRGLELLPVWWRKVEERYESLKYRALEDFCRDRPGLSARTIRDSWKKKWITERSFDELARQLEFGTRRELLDFLRGETNEEALGPENADQGSQSPLGESAKIGKPKIARLSGSGLQELGGHPVPWRSIAVLPFTNISADRDEDYFADGLSEDIINTLANVPELRVTARTSAFTFKGKTQDVRKIAESLNVATVLEGGVRRAGTRLRITAQLIRADDGCTLWAETYNRKLKSVFAIQREIARKIAAALHVKLFADNSYMPKFSAHEAYQKGRHEFFKTTPTSLERAKEYYEQAIEIDPNYALAHAALAGYYLVAGLTGSLPASQVMPEARANARKALKADDSLSEARAILGAVAAAHDYDWGEAEKQFGLALASKAVSALVRYYYAGFYLMPMGRPHEAVEEMERAIEQDPLNLLYRNNLGFYLYAAGTPERSSAEISKVLDTNKNYWPAYVSRGINSIVSGAIPEARSAAEKAYELADWSPGAVAIYAATLTLTEDKNRAEELLQRLEHSQRPSSVAMALYFLLCNNLDSAADWVEKIVEERDEPSFIRYLGSPMMKRLESSPRWPGIARNLNLVGQ